MKNNLITITVVLALIIIVGFVFGQNKPATYTWKKVPDRIAELKTQQDQLQKWTQMKLSEIQGEINYLETLPATDSVKVKQ